MYKYFVTIIEPCDIFVNSREHLSNECEKADKYHMHVDVLCTKGFYGLKWFLLCLKYEVLCIVAC